MRRKPLVASLALALALSIVGEASAGSGFSPVTADSPNAERIETLYYLLLAVAAAIFVLVEGALLLFIFRYRRRGRARAAEGPQIRGHTRLELIWTAIPVLILAVIAGFTFWQLPGIENIPSARAGDGDRLQITVEGRQFYWRFEYPNGAFAYDRLVVPRDRVVVLKITAPEYDVLHSWWVPAVGGKFDAIPGETTTTWLRARKTGTFEGQCGEYCGLQHSAMLATVEVVEPVAFERWLGARGSALEQGRSDLGREMFERVCAKCHNLDGEQLIGPNLRGNSTLAQRAALEQIVREGRGEMPAVAKDWTAQEFEALYAFVRTQAGGTGGGAS